MATTALFDLDASAPPYTRNYALYAVNDLPDIDLTLAGLLPGDVIQQVSFTAKVAVTDADNAATTVQKIWQPPNGTTGPQVTPVDPAASVYAISIPLTQADSVVLSTPASGHGYDIRLWVQRGGVTYVRTIQRGLIVTYVGWTSLAIPVGGGLSDQDGTILVDEGYD